MHGYIIKVRVVVKYLQFMGYQTLNYELIGISKRDATVVDFLEVGEVRRPIEVSFKKSAGYSKFKRYRNRAMLSPMFSSGITNIQVTMAYAHVVNENLYEIHKAKHAIICA